MQENSICQRAFSEIEIDTNGDVRTCCPSYLKDFYSIGNIFKVKSFDEIWYSDKAIKLRENILSRKYNFCNVEICNKKIDKEDMLLLCEKPPYPTLVRFAYDTQCNLKCTICRDSLVVNSQDTLNYYDSLIEPILMPILKNAKILSLTSSGEITASEHSQKILKRAAELYPNLKFEILTNGYLFNENFCNSIGITDRIDQIVISMHAMKKNTYEKIMRGSKFNTVLKNLDYIFQLHREKRINEVSIVYVVSSRNYKELPIFIEFCKKNNVNPIIWEYRKLGKTEMGNNIKKYTVWNKSHPQYNDFVKIINQIKNECRMPQLFSDLKPISKIQEYKNKIKAIFY